ncbi:SpaA isopeptide-forming pilin-related protein, partial [Flavonifractor plautii]
ENDIRPNLTVVKRDADTGAPVAGAVFTVKAADGHSVDEIKTGADGTATLENLLPGVYEVTEKSVPAPYLLDAPSQLVTLYPNRNHTVYFENHKKPILTIQKVDSITGNPIKGAKFQIWYASNSTDTGELNDLGTYFTDASGQIVLEGLRDGWYRV